MTKEEVLAKIDDTKILWNVKLQAGDADWKIIHFPCLLGVHVVEYSDHFAIWGYCYFKDPHDKALKEYQFVCWPKPDHTFKDLVFRLASGAIPLEFRG